MRGAKEVSTSEQAQKLPAELPVVLPNAVETACGTQMACTSTSASSKSRSSTTESVWLWAPLAVIAIATIVAYSPVLFNFFAGDDFVHLTWLKQAVQQPELIWRNFHSSWLDGTTTKFYRPLISVFMVTDYLGWGINALGFHITNLLFHMAGSAFLFLLLRDLVPGKHRSHYRLFAATAAAIFALYPLHPEAVSWITGRVDSIVTAFCLSSIWFYIRWRANNKPLWLVASLAAFVFGLTSKEMAITVPAVLAALELIQGFAIRQPVRSTAALCVDLANSCIKRPLLATWPFWLLIAAYFVVRYIALGTFVGGYDDSLLFIADPKAFIAGWLHAVRMMIVPINKELFGAHHSFTKIWEVLTATSVVLGGCAFVKKKELRPLLLFLGLWLVLCLIPVYKIFAIADDLQGSRLAYLATAPLSGLLAFGLTAMLPLRASALLAVAYTMMCGIILWNNNQPWREAGVQNNAIRTQLETIYRGVDNDPQTLLIGLPDQIHGAYVCRNSLWGMTKKPQLSKDLSNCLMVNEFEPVQPFGFLKRSLADNRQQVRIYRWSPSDAKFFAIQLPAVAEINEPKNLPFDATFTLRDGDKRPSALIDASDVSCFNADFVAVDVDIANTGVGETGADLLYSNSIQPQFLLGKRTHCAAPLKPGKQTLLFSLHSLPEWALGSAPAKLKLMLPPGCKATVLAARLVPPAVLIPRIDFSNSGYMGTKGYLHLGKDKPAQSVAVDASAIPGAVSTELEVTRANLLFEEQNGSTFSKVARKPIAAPLKGSIELNVKDYPAPGIYEARIWARNQSNEIVGVSSDHIVIAVDP